MAEFGYRSKSRLATCHQDIIDLCLNVIDNYDFTVIWGYRSEREQNDCYDRGTSFKQFPLSKHNKNPSIAVDVAPWHAASPHHIRWNNEREFIFLAGRFMQAADSMEIQIRWGGDWDMDDDLYDRNVPFDLGHFELLV